MKNEKRFYLIGGLRILIDGPEFSESKYLAPFRVPDGSPDLTFRVRVKAAVTEPDAADPCVRVIRHDHTGEVILKITEHGGGMTDAELNAAYADLYGSHLVTLMVDLPSRVLGYGGVFLHSSFVGTERGAILFTANKQVGKSTQAALWEKYRGASVVNGDRALLRFLDGRLCACGSPYCGTSAICRNSVLPVRAIVILSQAEINSVRRASVREALEALLDGCSYRTQDRAQIERVMDLASSVIGAVPFYCLACTPDVRAIEKLEEML